MDEDGFLYVRGRMKNMFITSMGRNVSPEWVEREMTCENSIAHAFVVGAHCQRDGALPYGRQKLLDAQHRRGGVFAPEASQSGHRQSILQHHPHFQSGQGQTFPATRPLLQYDTRGVGGMDGVMGQGEWDWHVKFKRRVEE